MTNEEAYEVVFDDLLKCNIFNGIYDAKHGNEHFMYGICCVMEVIATKVSDECHIEFLNTFYQNMIMSESKKKYIKLEKWGCVEDDNYAGGGYWECPSCKDRFSFQGFNMLNHMPYCPKCGSRVKTALEGGKTMTNEEAQARWICCPMCDRDTCNRNADDCDVKKWIEKKEAEND